MTNLAETLCVLENNLTITQKFAPLVGKWANENPEVFLLLRDTIPYTEEGNTDIMNISELSKEFTDWIFAQM